MHAGRHYSMREVFLWTRRETAIFLLIAVVPTLLYSALGWTWLTMPWLPIALVGTAVAFITGFKNNTSYNRLWEARQIWGGIVNTSRAWAVMALDYVHAPTATAAAVDPAAASPTDAQRALIRRHLAWITALRYQLRQPRAWENMQLSHNVEFRAAYTIPEHRQPLDEALRAYLSPDELTQTLAYSNRATYLLRAQSKALRDLVAEGALSELRQLELVNALATLYEHQGKCERIKNFPYPRQFATINLIFTWLFIALVPFGLLQEFQKLGGHFIWLTIPASVLVSWVFHTMDKIGESSENPFEGSANDVPMAGLCRAIEIDLRELLGDKDIPPPLQPVNNILM
jgi:ion channel-forming bestrophin family protein